jgi:hypothetical protein
MKSQVYFKNGLPIINNVNGDTSKFVEIRNLGFNLYNNTLETFQTFMNYINKIENFALLKQSVKKFHDEEFDIKKITVSFKNALL